MSHRTLSPKLSSLSAAALGVAASAALTLAPAIARAQGAPPPPPAQPAPPPPGGYYAPPPAGYAPPPAGYAPPPAGYAPPPAGYAPPGGYYAPPGAPGAAGPRVIEDWDDGQPVPAGYRVSTKMRTGLVVGGAVTLGVLWVLTAIPSTLAADFGHNGSDALGAIPVVGPFALLSQDGGYASVAFVCVLDGLGQVAGAAMLIAGIAAPRKVLVRTDIGNVTILPKPMTFGKSGGGMGLAGTF